MEDRLVVLETKVSYQDHTIEELNAVVTKQQEQIDQLKAQILLIIEHLKANVPFDIEGADELASSS